MLYNNILSNVSDMNSLPWYNNNTGSILPNTVFYSFSEKISDIVDCQQTPSHRFGAM